MVSPTIPRQKKLSEAEIHFCSSRRLFFNNPPGHIQLHLKTNCSSRLGIYIDTSTENIQGTLPFIFYSVYLKIQGKLIFTREKEK